MIGGLYVKRKLFSGTMSVFLTASLLAGCTGGSGAPGAQPQKGSDAPKDALVLKDGKFDPPVKMTMVIGHEEPFRPNESMNDNKLTRWAKERLGIELQFLWQVTSQNNGYPNKLRLELAAGNKLPDVIVLSAHGQEGYLAHELVDSGMFREVGTLFDKYANKYWKDTQKEYDYTWNPHVRDGKRMALPMFRPALHNDVVMHLRKDWLDKLGLKVPTTVEELEVVLDAFTNKDPDGNGVKDTYGITVSGKDGFASPVGDMAWLFGAYGTLPGIWTKGKDGSLQYGSVQPGAKQALEKLNSWMQKGYMHKEVGLWDGNKSGEIYAAGKAGVIFSPRWGLSRFQDVIKNVKGAEIVQAPIPKGPGGQARIGTDVLSHVALINKDMKNPEAWFVLQNYLWDHYANPKPGSEFEFGMFEGYDYVFDNGKMSTDRPVIQKVTGFERVRHYNHVRTPLDPKLFVYSLYKGAKGLPLETPYEKAENERRAKDPYDIKTGGIQWETKDHSVINAYNGQFTKTMSDKGELLDKMELETFTKIMYGNLPISAFDKFVTDWKTGGGDAITKEVNDWQKNLKK